MRKKILAVLPLLAIMLLGVSARVFAGTEGTEFAEVETALLDWSQGGLGRALALGVFLVGVGAGIARQSLMAIATGLGGGMAVYYMPTIIGGIVTAMIQ